jgi:hypothetical protein
VTDPTVHQVKVTPQDIDSVSGKLQAFARDLPPGEQNVVAWLLGRAAQAPVDPDLAQRADRVLEPAFRDQLTSSLGIAQFETLRPGSTFAGSTIGVTGTVMF